MNNTLVTLEDRELSAVRGGWGRDFGCGGYANGGCGNGGDDDGGYGLRRFGWGFRSFGFSGYGFGDGGYGAERDYDIRPGYCVTYVPVGDCD